MADKEMQLREAQQKIMRFKSQVYEPNQLADQLRNERSKLKYFKEVIAEKKEKELLE